MATPDRDELVRLRLAHFRGQAKIHLKHLTFETDSLPGTRRLDDSNVDRLVKIFELEGCSPLEPEHHVPVIISLDVLNWALNNAHKSLSDLLSCANPPWISPESDVRLVCLHGKHRLAAAQEFLKPGHKWWVVDLYLDSVLPPLA